MEQNIKVEITEMSMNDAKTVVGLAIIGYATVCYCTGWLAVKGIEKAYDFVDSKVLKNKRDKQWKAYSKSLKNAEVKDADISEYEKAN